MKVFEAYSKYYNLLYSDKNYEGEAKYVLELIKRFFPNSNHILDVGCGTGIHANLLSQEGYDVEGLDMSAEMLKTAKENYPKIIFYQSDARSFNLNKKYDVITSLFHVASYQTTNEDIINYIKTIYKHLNNNGIFIFDFWYGPAVLNDMPVVRVKRLEDDNTKFTRIAEPEMHQNNNIVDVNYEILIENKQINELKRIRETHEMRYFFLPEIKLLLEMNGFEMQDSFEWMSKKEPNLKSWNVACIAKKY